MSDRILLFITDREDQALAWYPPGDTSGAPGRGGWADFERFMATGQDRAGVIVILSDHGIGRLLVPIPSAKRHQALQALPFALEDLAVDEPTQLFTELAERPLTPGQWPVLLVDAARRERILAHLQALGVTVQAMVAMADLLPVPDEQTYAVWQAPFSDLTVVLTGPHQGFVLPVDDRTGDLRERVGLMLSRLSVRPERVRFHRTTAGNVDTASASSAPANWPTDVALEWGDEPDAATWPTLWRTGLAHNRPLSMVTAPRQAQSRLLRRRWRQVALVASVLLLFVVIGQGLMAWQMARQADALQAQVVRDFHAALPQAKRLVNARVQLQQALDQVSAGPQRDQFLTALTAFGSVFHVLRQQDDSLGIQSLRFADQQLSVEVTGQQYAVLQTMLDRLKATGGLQVRQIDSGVDDGKAHMRLRIEPQPVATGAAT